jgi:alpha-mannosidase
VSAEATVRNLQIGHRVGGRFGEVQKVGYMPDSFGHIAQMPQILRGAGIDSFIYTRGNGDEIDEIGHEYYWVAPDGSEVLAINQCGGYCNAGGLGFDEEWEAHTQRRVDIGKAVQRIHQLFASMAERSQGDIYLVNNGCDHFPPQRDLGAILSALRQEFPGTDFKHADLRSYVDAVLAAGFVRNRYAGELAQGRLHHILAGVWSARMYLKQQNDRAQRTLSAYAEPWSSYMYFVYARSYPTGLLQHAWKLLLQNHPHDSICGCSTDDVHRQMGPRFSAVIDTGEQLVREHLSYLTPTFARERSDDHATTICVANPLPQRRTEVVERLVVLQPSTVDIGDLQLVDQTGTEVPFEIVERQYVERFWGIDYRTELSGSAQLELFQVYADRFGDRIIRGADQREVSDSFLTLHFLAQDLPGIGHRQFHLRTAGAGEVRTQPYKSDDVVVSGNSIENEYYKLRVHEDGTLDAIDKAAGITYHGLNQLEDTADVGDEYDYAPCIKSATVTSVGVKGSIRTVRCSRFWGQLEVNYSLQLPAAVERDRTARSKELVSCRVRARIGLKRGSRAIEIELWLDNKAEDHRLRAQFPTALASDTVVSHGHFYINHRPIDIPVGEDWRQPPHGTYPQQDYSLVQGNDRGVALLNKGLPEIQATRDEKGQVTLFLTLLRSVGWLSRDDMATRRCENAGPTLHTPEAQCKGEHLFEYALVPFTGDHVAAEIDRISQHYRTPVVAIQGVEDGHVAGQAGLVEKSGNATCISAVKKHDLRDTLEIRMYNLTGDPIDESLQVGLPVVRAWRLDLLGERLCELLQGDNECVAVPLKPHEIVTVELELSHS